MSTGRLQKELPQEDNREIVYVKGDEHSLKEDRFQREQAESSQSLGFTLVPRLGGVFGCIGSDQNSPGSRSLKGGQNHNVSVVVMRVY